MQHTMPYRHVDAYQQRPNANIKQICIALGISITMHFLVVRALPWLESTKVKPPATIVAELQVLPPPPPPAPAVEPPPEPVVKPEQTVPEKSIEKPAPKPQTVAQPVLATKQAAPTPTEYSVPDTPQPVVAPTAPAAPAVPEVVSAPSESAPSSAKNVATESSSNNTFSDSDVWDEFGRDLQSMCERHKRYPEIARRRGLQGAGKVLVRISAEGRATSISIQQSTGEKVLDEQAIEMVRKSLDDVPVPSKFKGRQFKLTIPVDFKLE